MLRPRSVGRPAEHHKGSNHYERQRKEDMRQGKRRVGGEDCIERCQLRWTRTRGEGKRRQTPENHCNRNHNAAPEPYVYPQRRCLLFQTTGASSALVCVHLHSPQDHEQVHSISFALLSIPVTTLLCAGCPLSHKGSGSWRRLVLQHTTTIAAPVTQELWRTPPEPVCS